MSSKVKVIGMSDPKTLERIRRSNMDKQIAQDAEKDHMDEEVYRKQIALAIKSAMDDIRISRHRADPYARRRNGNGYASPECHRPYDYTTRVWRPEE